MPPDPFPDPKMPISSQLILDIPEASHIPGPLGFFFGGSDYASLRCRCTNDNFSSFFFSRVEKQKRACCVRNLLLEGSMTVISSLD